jgi:hypothetical protein
VGYGALVAVGLLQTAARLAPLNPGVAAAVLCLLGVILFGVPSPTALLALRTPTAASLAHLRSRPRRRARWQFLDAARVRCRSGRGPFV